MIKKIIVGIDFSENAQAALEVGCVWADLLKVPLEVVHVHQPYIPPLPESYVALPDLLEDERATEHEKTRVHASLAGHPARETVAVGLPAEELLRVADPDSLLVLGHERHSALAHLIRGSTTHRVLRAARCPVLIVPAPEHPGREN